MYPFNYLETKKNVSVNSLTEYTNSDDKEVQDLPTTSTLKRKCEEVEEKK